MNPDIGGSGFVCPDCGAGLGAVDPHGRPERCPECGLGLTGPAAARLWAVDQQIWGLRRERVALIAMLRASTAAAVPAAAGGTVAAAGDVAQPDPARPVPPNPYAPPATAAGRAVVAGTSQRPRQEWSRRRVQNLLLTLGVLLLAVSAVIFIAVNWGVLGPAGRAAVMVAVTVLTGAGAVVAHRRGLPATAEAVAALTVVLLAVDAAGLRFTAKLHHIVSVPTYTALSIAVIVPIAAGWLRILPVRALRFTVAVGPQLVLPLAFATTIQDAARPPALAAAVFAVQALAVEGLRFGLRGREVGPLTARALLVGETGAGVIALLNALVTAYVAGTWFFVGPTVLVALAVGVAAGALAGVRPGAAGAAGPSRSAAGTTAGPALAEPGSAAAAAGQSPSPALTAASRTSAPPAPPTPLDPRTIPLATATALLLTAAATPVPHLRLAWQWPAVEALALAAALLVLALPRVLRQGPAIIAAALGAAAAVSTLLALTQAVAVPTAAAHRPWAATWAEVRRQQVAEAVRALYRDPATSHPWSGTPQTGLIILGLVATVVVTAWAAGFAALRFATAPLAVVSLLIVPMELKTTVPVAIAWDLALGATAVVLAANRLRHKEIPHRDTVGLCVAGVGLFFLAHGVVWSAGTPVLTLGALAFLIVLAFAAMAAGPRLAPYRLGAAGVATALVPLDFGLLLLHRHVPAPEIGMALALAAAGAAAGAVLADRHPAALGRVLVLQPVALVTAVVGVGLAADRPRDLAVAVGALLLPCVIGMSLHRAHLTAVWPPLFQALAVAETALAVHLARPAAGPAHVALAAATAAAVLMVAAPYLHRRDLAPSGVAATLVTAPVAYVMALTAVLGHHQPTTSWPALLAGGVGGGVATTVGHLRRQNPEVLRAAAAGSGFLLLASSWVRLAEAHVHAVEPYTIPSALVLLAFGHVRRRRDPAAPSWPCYGPGLLLGLTPALLQALGDPGLLRPALVGVAALAVLLLGVRGRLQAPLAVGGAVLAVDALAQLSPFLASAYNATPRWVLIAAVGALLLGVGATYERRIRDVRTLGQKFTALK